MLESSKQHSVNITLSQDRAWVEIHFSMSKFNGPDILVQSFRYSESKSSQRPLFSVNLKKLQCLFILQYFSQLKEFVGLKETIDIVWVQFSNVTPLQSSWQKHMYGQKEAISQKTIAGSTIILNCRRGQNVWLRLKKFRLQ